MKEEFLHYLWLHKKFSSDLLTTSDGLKIEIIRTGTHNLNSGPDFFNAQLSIGGQFWAGTLEVHCKSSDWYAHYHETDTAYDNVILHVVWEHDVEVFRSDRTKIPVLELKKFVEPSLWNQYKGLIQANELWIPCEDQFPKNNSFSTKHFLERLYVERLERKTELFYKLLECSNNNWEAVLFQSLVKGFGLNLNGDSFLATAESIPFSLVRKVQGKSLVLEAILMGQSGLLDSENEAGYFHKLKAIYTTYTQNYSLAAIGIPKPYFFRLRPSNFPTIRISQIANLYKNQPSLFAKIIEASTLKEFYEILKTKTSEYWETHYTFDKCSKKRVKSISQAFMNLLIINVIIPLRFCYNQYVGKDATDQLFSIARDVSAEKNSIVQKFNTLGLTATDALESQSLIQLKQQYCQNKRCLECAIGNSLLQA